MNVAQFLVDTLSQSGVKRIYGICGDSLNAITEVIRATKSLEWIHVRHEEVAAFAAGAEAALSESLTVCAGSCGPGNLHLINGLYDCHKSRVPVLAIAAHIPTHLIGTEYFQETNPQKIFAECSHFCEMVSHPEQLPQLLKSAMETAVQKKGVAVLIIPGNIAFQEVKKEIQKIAITSQNPALKPNSQEVLKASEILNKAKNITILAGAGCSGSHKKLIELAQKLKAPIVHTLRGKEFIEHDNPLDVGMTGLLGLASGFHAMKDCEVLLMLGTDFPYSEFYPEKKIIIQVDERGQNIGRRVKVDLGIVGDVNPALTLLLKKIKAKKDDSHLKKALASYTKAKTELNDLAIIGTTKNCHPQYLVKLINEIADKDAIFTCDVGTPTVWAARYLKMNGKRRLLGSFNHGSMANALPQAIGAQCLYPQRQVISLSGDGGFSMLMGDILTLNQHNLPIKLIIFNNSSLSFVETEMKAAGLLETATDLKNPDFAKMAESIGIKGYRVENPQDLKETLTKALKAPGSAVIDVVVNRQELAMPPHASLEQVKGFGLFTLKAVLSGKGDELENLVKTNFWR